MTEKQAHTLLHVGYIKTATTFLQEEVFSDPEGDLELAAGPDTRAQGVANIILADDYSFDPVSARKRMEAFAAPVRERGKLPVWSEEMLLGNPPARQYNGFSNARKASEIYPEAHVLITIRRQPSIALSMYREYVLGGGRVPLEQFIGTGNETASFTPVLRPEFLMFDRAIRHYIELFGPDRVLVLPQEMLSRDPDKYALALSEFTGCRVITESGRGKVHAGEGLIALAMRRAGNRLVVRDPTRPGRRGLDALANRVVRLTNRMVPEWLEAARERQFKAAIAARYAGSLAESNRETARMTGLDLVGYGYEM